MKAVENSKAALGCLGKSVPAWLIASALAVGLPAYATGESVDTSNRLPSAKVPEEVASGRARLVAPVKPGQIEQLALVLPLQNEAALDTLLQELQDPASPHYHQYLSMQDFTSQFGTSQADYNALISWAQSNGLTVTQTYANRHVLDIQGTVQQIDHALRILLTSYQSADQKRTFFAPDREPSPDLPVPLLDIKGLTDVAPRRSHLRRGTAQQQMDAISKAQGSGPRGSYLPSDMRAAYYGAGPLTGSGQTVGIFSFDGYYTSDVNLYYTTTGMKSSVPVTNVLVSGYNGACQGGAAGCDDGEQVLDIVNVIGMAPGLKSVRFYEGNFATDILNQMATDNLAKIITCSWGGGDFSISDDSIYKEMAAQGQTFLNATGDDGAYNGITWAAPSLDAYIVDVGGTDLATTGPGGAWSSETAWPFSSGGFYRQAGVAIPAYQQLAGVISSTNLASSSYRNDPDVAAEADFDNPTVSNGQFQLGFGGTSFAAPRWAGILALANQQSVAAGRGTVGFINTKLYKIALSSSYTSEFHDITIGNNPPDEGIGAGFVAIPGFDLVTGWGSPIGGAFIDALTQ